MKFNLENIRHTAARSNNKFAFKGLLRKLKYAIIGKETDKGLIFKLFIYLVLIDAAYIYLKPVFYMLTTMVKDLPDLMDPSVTWVPKRIFMENLGNAWEGLHYMKSFAVSLGISTTASVCQVVSCAIAGYAFARLSFPFKKFWFLCLIFIFIMPPQITILPTYLVFLKSGILNTAWTVLLPTFFGHGLKGALFVIIFRQFFSTQPKELEEAAKIDGASVYRVFFRVMLPLSKPAILVVFLFSFVWHWNDSFLQGIFMSRAHVVPLSLGLTELKDYLNALASSGSGGVMGQINLLKDEPIKMAAAFLMIMPLLVLYAFAQRWFIESVERAGLVE
ncbi:carbohydrate ABC transporter permease [Cohnella yongneupensis]|uniref:Carbohydrate ABC transporter permease n=1 Tax=Cohnella yongneupensis TaxID=425006 RepID=A0ABW0R894_9BACL